MSFEYSTEDDKICAMFLNKVIRNGGTWEKQGQRYFGFESGGRDDKDFLKSNFGVEIEDGQIVKTADGLNRWADYGSRSLIPTIFMYVTDNLGVVKKYKIRGNGNLRDGWSPNPDKTELLWERGEVETPHWMIEEQKQKEIEEITPKPHVTEGRYVASGRVISLKESFYEGPFTTSMTLKMLVEFEDGSRVFGTVPSAIAYDVEAGHTVEFTATFKAKEPGFGLFSRPAKAKIIG